MVSALETTKMREAIISVYQSAEWIKKVNLMMPDQVQAIYFRLKRQNKIK